MCAPSRCKGGNGSECGSSKNPCGSINEVMEGMRYMSERFSGWIVLMEGEHGKEEGSIVGEGKDVKIRGGEGEGEVVKLVGGIEGEGEGIIWGRNVSLSMEGIKMKEIEGDCMNVPLIVWSGGYVDMKRIEIIRIGGGGGSGVVMSVNGSRGSEMSECIIRYEWKNSSSIRGRYMKNEEGGSMCEWNESVIVLKENNRFWMNGCEVNGSKSGGISVNGGDVNLTECVFDGTAPVTEGFESVQRNLLCSNNATITMNGYNGETIKKNTSLWIVIGDCRFETSEEKPDSLLYVPTLDRVRYDDTNVRLTFYGDMMIGCNLFYVIFYSDGKTFTVNPVPLSGVESESETLITTSLGTALSSEMNRARLLYGVNGITEEKRILWPGEEYEEEEEGVERKEEGEWGSDWRSDSSDSGGGGSRGECGSVGEEEEGGREEERRE